MVIASVPANPAIRPVPMAVPIFFKAFLLFSITTFYIFLLAQSLSSVFTDNFLEAFFKNFLCFLVFFFGYFARCKSLSENIIGGVSGAPITPRCSKNPNQEEDPGDPPNGVHSVK